MKEQIHNKIDITLNNIKVTTASSKKGQTTESPHTSRQQGQVGIRPTKVINKDNWSQQRSEQKVVLLRGLKVDAKELTQVNLTQVSRGQSRR